MTLALWTLLVTALMPIVCAGISKAGERDYDNRNPREWLARREGYRARAHAAQQNSWEALIVYTAGLAAAFMGGVAPETIGTLALVFLVSRFAYLGCYLADWATLRSLVWLVGFGVSIAMIVLGARSLA